MNCSRVLAGAAVLVLAAGTAACGVQSVAPKVQLRDAVGAVAEAGRASFSVSLPSSPDDVRAFLAATGQRGVDDAALADVLGVQLGLAYDGGDDGHSTADDTGLVQVRIGGTTYGEARIVDDVTYLRADVPALGERFPGMANDVDGIRAELRAAELGALAPTAEAALAGEWVSVDAGEGSWLAEQQADLADASPQQPDDLGPRLLALVGEAMSSSVSVTRAGEDGTGDRLLATVNIRELYSNVVGDLADLFAEAAPGAEEGLPAAGEVPSRDVSAVFWVDDGELRRIEVDLAQFLDEPAGHFVIRADIGDVPAIEAPNDAVDVDMEELVALSGASPDQLFGLSVTPVGGGVEAAAIAVDTEFQAYAAYLGVAPTVQHLPVIAEYFAGLTPPLELVAVGEQVQVTYDGEVACLALAPEPMVEGTVTPGPC